jgi:hypothetical protein
MRTWSLIAALALAGPLGGLRAEEPRPLPLGELADGQVPADGPSVWRFQATCAGALTVLVRAKDKSDLALYVTDKDGQVLPDGEVDRGTDGDNGAEQLVSVLTAPGTYLVQVVAPQGGEGQYLIGGSWLPAPALAREPDPDGSPSAARALAPDAPVEDELGPARGDRWDWLVVTPAQAGKLRLTVLAAEGDLRLELFQEGRFLAPVARVDDDLGGVSGHEAVEVEVEAGKRYFFRVLAVDLSAEKLPYKVSCALH